MDVKRSPVPLPDNATCTPVLVKVFFCYVYSDFHYDKSVFSDDHIQVIRSVPIQFRIKTFFYLVALLVASAPGLASWRLRFRLLFLLRSLLQI